MSTGSPNEYGLAQRLARHIPAWHSLPAAPARHRSLQPAKPAPRSGFFHQGRDSDFGILPKNPSPGQRRRSGSDAVLTVSLPECFFHHSHAQPSILAWAQDCHTQSWRGHRIATQSWREHRIATLNPGAGTGLPRRFPENAGSAVLYSTTPPDSPPGLRGKHRQCVGTQRRTPTRRPDCPENSGCVAVR